MDNPCGGRRPKYLVVSGAGVPDPPKLQVSCKSPHWVVVSWEEPVNNGATVTDYRVEWQHRPDTDFTQIYYGGLSSYDVRGLSPATTYTFRVQVGHRSQGHKVRS